MSTEQNKTIVRRNFEALNKGNLDVADELLATDYIGHFAIHPEAVAGVEAYKQFMSGYYVAFPNLRMDIEDMLAEGDKVVVRWTVRGTHQGDLAGIPPTGKQVTITGTWILRVVGGKIAEQWGVFDALGLMQQLGVIPMPEQ